MNQKPILKVGKNCWQKQPASRVAFLIDGENYYPALHQAIQRAKHTVMILGWDFDTRIRLIRDQDEDNEFPAELGQFLNKALSKNPNLNIYILTWDWAMVYSLEREWLPIKNSKWENQDRLHFKLDGECPTGASQHQKLVVIDNEIAFCGGFDLGKSRWDSSKHLPNDPRRKDPDNQNYPPFHDIQTLVEGDIAAALGDLFQDRWYRVSSENISLQHSKNNETAWPKSIKPWFEDIDIAISRTFPKYKDYPEIREIERLYIDAITAANDLIYIENQYLSSWSIAEALIKSLKAEKGPDIIIVLPLKTGGWLEQATMDVLRGRVACKLHAADRFNRLRICYPYRKALGDVYISVHAKLCIIDDKFVRVGSANLSNRSMGFDSECDLAIEANNDAEQATIKQFRERLLSEHLGIEEKNLHDMLKNTSLSNLIDQRKNNTHTLRKLDCTASEYADDLLPSSTFIDPEKTIPASELKSMFLSKNEEPAATKQWWKIATVLVFALVLAATWRWTPLHQLVNLNTLQAFAEKIQYYPYTPIIVLSIFSIAGLLAFPVTLLIMATGLTFGPVWGSAYAMLGALLSAILGYYVGYFLGKNSIEKLGGSSTSKLNKRLAEHGILTLITVRIVPIAPFTIINLMAGSSRIKTRDFILGTAIGMTPGILSITLFAGSLLDMLKNPELKQILVFFGVLILITLMLLGIRKLIKLKKL